MNVDLYLQSLQKKKEQKNAQVSNVDLVAVVRETSNLLKTTISFSIIHI